MTCGFDDDATKRAYVRRVVREGIREAGGGSIKITQETFLGQSGLGHASPIRRKYYGAIRRRVQTRGCDIEGLSPTDFVDAKIVQVKDVTDLVFKNLG